MLELTREMMKGVLGGTTPLDIPAPDDEVPEEAPPPA